MMRRLKVNRWFWMIQGLTVLFSLAGAVVKVASLQMQKYGFWALPTLFCIAVFTILMMIYAFFWQKVIAHLPLFTAYLARSLGIFWALIWARLFFGETIAPLNLVGAFVVFAGTVLVMYDES